MLKFKGYLSARHCGTRDLAAYCVFSVFWGLVGSPGPERAIGAIRDSTPKATGVAEKGRGGLWAGSVNIAARTMGVAEKQGYLSNVLSLDF